MSFTLNRKFLISAILIIIPLFLSAFTHLWNLDGFPSIYRDEDHYIRKAMHILQGHGLQEGPNDLISVPTQPYDHPYFGPLFLAATLGIIGYPDILNPSEDTQSIGMIYVVPRILMGLLAILDTFLIYKIAEYRYNKTVGFIASVIFALMPSTWILRRVWLEPIQMPFLLISILCAIIYAKRSMNNDALNKIRSKFLPILFSGISLGLAIFTKIPVFVMIPLILFLIVSPPNKRSNIKYIGLWFVPVIFIPLIWPAYAISIGQFDDWVNGIFWQTTGRLDVSLLEAMNVFFVIDPFILVLGGLGLAFTIIRKDFLLLLWIIPFLTFLQLIGYVSYWFFILLLPAFSIGAGILISGLCQKTRIKTIQKVLPFVAVSVIGVFGLANHIALMNMDLNSFHFETMSFIVKEIKPFVDDSADPENNKGTDNDNVTVLGNNFWIWLPKYMIDKDHDNIYKNFYNKGDLKTKKILFVAGMNFEKDMVRYNKTQENVEEISELYKKSDLLAMMENEKVNSSEVHGAIDLDPRGPKRIEIRSNY